MRLVNRLFWSVITLLGTATLIFILTSVIPGDVARIVAGPKATPEVLRQVRERYHLDDPVLVRLGHYYVQLLHGDLGHSFVTDQPVAQAILTRLPMTAALCATARAISSPNVRARSAATDWRCGKTTFRCGPPVRATG